jgi:predicted metal-dependent hydrolase
MTGPLNVKRHPKAEPVADPASDPRLEEGLRLFNAGEHWHAHEAWEPLWMGLEGEEKLFLQGLIMAAAMLVQHKNKVARGVENHWANVRQRLGHRPPVHWGLDVAGLLAQLAAYADDVGAWRLSASDVRIRRA